MQPLEDAWWHWAKKAGRSAQREQPAVEPLPMPRALYARMGDACASWAQAATRPLTSTCASSPPPTRTPIPWKLALPQSRRALERPRTKQARPLADDTAIRAKKRVDLDLPTVSPLKRTHHSTGCFLISPCFGGDRRQKVSQFAPKSILGPMLLGRA